MKEESLEVQVCNHCGEIVDGWVFIADDRIPFCSSCRTVDPETETMYEIDGELLTEQEYGQEE